jgi:hypothetical protein
MIIETGWSGGWDKAEQPQERIIVTLAHYSGLVG